MSEPISPLSEADPRSLDEYFARKPPYDAQTLNAIKAEFRRLRERMKIEQASGKAPRAKKAAKVETTKSVEFDLFAAEDEPKSAP
jgi:hypothetical protein